MTHVREKRERSRLLLEKIELCMRYPNESATQIPRPNICGCPHLTTAKTPSDQGDGAKKSKSGMVCRICRKASATTPVNKSMNRPHDPVWKQQLQTRCAACLYGAHSVQKEKPTKKPSRAQAHGSVSQEECKDKIVTTWAGGSKCRASNVQRESVRRER